MNERRSLSVSCGKKQQHWSAPAFNAPSIGLFEFVFFEVYLKIPIDLLQHKLQDKISDF